VASDSDGYLVEGRPVNALADVSTARRLASTVEDAEARRLGLPVSKARAHVARRLGASPGTLENIRRERLKNIPHWLMARIRSAFVAVLQNEIGRLEHEIAIHLQTGTDHRDDDLAKAQAQVAAAKQLIGKGPRPGA